MNNGELIKREKLHAEATQLAATLFSRTLREPLDSPRLQRLKKAANRAGDRAERRYQASLEAYRSQPRYT